MKIQTEYIKVSDKKLPLAISGKKLVIISDLHNNVIGKNNEIIKNLLKEIKPDGVIIAGDLFNGVGNNINSKDFFEYVNSMYPTYMVKGNHEDNLSYSNQELLDYITNYSQINSNFILLDNNCTEVFGVKLYGFTGDEKAYKRLFARKVSVEEIEKKLGIADKNCYNIVVSHNPEGEIKYSEWGADMIISGHLHGGFIRIFNKGIITPQLKLFPKYTSGEYAIGDKCKLIISRGMGTHFPNPRLFNKSHLIVLDFK